MSQDAPPPEDLFPPTALLAAVDDTVDAAPPGWQPGDRVLDRYTVLGVLGRGGMGEVLRVRHEEWGVDLAVKAPLAAHLQRAGAREDFVREAETWIALGAHPHIVTCWFVRVVDGLPRVFAELVEGGSLAERIAGGHLGGAGALPRVLDVATQVAWGLAHAHRLGFVHQDVKPANVLMTPAGVAKVTDFGLARARGDAGAGGYTPRYAAPEQLDGRPLGPACDVFAWAATLAEMLIGEARWAWGAAAGLSWQAWLAAPDGPLPPPALAALVADCLALDPAARPTDPHELAERLRAIYHAVTGHAHPRTPPDAAASLADGLNNRAVSLLDLGRPEAALTLLDQALADDPHHPLAAYNRALLRWRRGAIDDEAALRALEVAGRAGAERATVHVLRGWIHVERGDAAAAARELAAAAEDGPDEHAAPELDRVRAHARPGQRRLHDVPVDHGAAVALAMSADGRRVLCAAGLEARLGSGAELGLRLAGHGNLVTAVAMTPDGETLVTAGDDRLARIWSADGALRGMLAGHTDPVRAVAIAADGRRVLTGARDGIARVYDEGAERHVLAGHGSGLTAVALTASGRRAVTAAHDGRFHLWDLGPAERTAVTAAHDGAIEALWLAPEGHLLATAGADRAVRLWDLTAAAPRLLLDLAHAAPVHALAGTGDGRLLVSGDAGGEVRVRDTATGRTLRRFEAHPRAVLALAIDAGGARLATAGADGRLRVHTLDLTPRPAPHLVVRPRAAEDLVAHQAAFERALAEARAALAADHIAAAIAAVEAARALPGYARAEPALTVWRAIARRARRGDLRDLWPAGSRADHARGVECLALGPDGSVLASGGRDGHIVLLGPDGTALTCPGHAEAVIALAFAGTDLCSVGADRTLRAGPHTWRLDAAPSALTATSEAAFVGRADGHLERVDLAGGAPSNWPAHEEEVTAVAAGRHLFTAGRDGLLRAFTFAGAPVATCRPAAPVLALAATPAGVLAGTRGGELLIWAPGEPPTPLGEHADAVTALAVAGPVAATVAVDGTLCLWDLPARRCLRRLRADDGPLTAVALAPDAQRLYLAGARTTTWTLDWRLDPERDGAAPRGRHRPS